MWIDSNNCAFYISAYLEKEDLVNLAESLYEKWFETFLSWVSKIASFHRISVRDRKDTRAADRTYFTTDWEYIITDEEQLNEKYSDVHYYTYTDFVNKNKSMASHFQQLIYRGLYLEPVQWTIG